MVELNNFNKINYNFTGIFRGIVEDNSDPLDSGRVRVRIWQLHTEDGKELPVDSLPWAEPALGLYWSGGGNILNKDHSGKTPDQNDIRYNPSPPGDSPETQTLPSANSIFDKGTDSNSGKTKTQTEFYDNFGNVCGTGGFFTVPKRGNWVFLFFENGNHMKPIYFAMAPSGTDWNTQKSFRSGEINQKINQIDGFKQQFEPRKEAIGDDWAKNAKVDALVEKPKLSIKPIDVDTPNRDVSCLTSLNGTSIIVDNSSGKEQIFIIHKNYMENTDDEGNRKVYIGKRNHNEPENSKNPVNPLIKDPDVNTNYEIGVEGNHILHVFGNYDMYIKGRTHIQCDEHVQIDARKSVGIVSRTGDCDIILEKGNLNIDVQNGYVDARIKNNLNAHIEGSANLLIDKDLKATVKGNSDILIEKDAKINAQNADILINGDTKLTTNNMDINAAEVKISGNLHIGGNNIIGGNCDIGGTARIRQNMYVQTGIDCGGYLRNRGIADIGSPVIAHGLIVSTGQGSGTGAGANSPSTPSQAQAASIAKQETVENKEK